MTQSFECPNCGGTIDYHGTEGASVRCPYCGRTVIVPSELRAQTPETITVDFQPNTSVVSRSRLSWIVGIIVLFVICTVVIPLAGAGLGIWAAIMGVSQATSFAGNVRSTVVAIVTEVPPPSDIAPSAAPAATPSPTPGFAGVVMRFGSAGTGPGRLNDARSLALDNAGRIYVGDYQDGRVQVFDAAGKFVSQYSAGNSRTLIFSLAGDRQGIIYAAADGQIQRYDSATRKQLSPLQYAGGNRFGYVATTADGGLVGVWYEQREGIITSIEGHRDDLVRFDADGKTVNVIPGFISSQTGDAELDANVAADGLGNIYVLAGEFGRAVFKFSPEGKFVTRFGSEGSAPDQFESPGSIAVDSQGRVYVGDSRRIIVFDGNGHYVATIPLDATPDAMAFNDKDELFLVARSQVLKLVLNKK